MERDRSRALGNLRNIFCGVRTFLRAEVRESSHPRRYGEVAVRCTAERSSA